MNIDPRLQVNWDKGVGHIFETTDLEQQNRDSSSVEWESFVNFDWGRETCSKDDGSGLDDGNVYVGCENFQSPDNGQETRFQSDGSGLNNESVAGDGDEFLDFGMERVTNFQNGGVSLKNENIDLNESQQFGTTDYHGGVLMEDEGGPFVSSDTIIEHEWKLFMMDWHALGTQNNGNASTPGAELRRPMKRSAYRDGVVKPEYGNYGTKGNFDQQNWNDFGLQTLGTVPGCVQWAANFEGSNGGFHQSNYEMTYSGFGDRGVDDFPIGWDALMSDEVEEDPNLDRFYEDLHECLYGAKAAQSEELYNARMADLRKGGQAGNERNGKNGVMDVGMGSGIWGQATVGNNSMSSGVPCWYQSTDSNMTMASESWRNMRGNDCYTRAANYSVTDLNVAFGYTEYHGGGDSASVCEFAHGAAHGAVVGGAAATRDWTRSYDYPASHRRVVPAVVAGAFDPCSLTTGLPTQHQPSAFRKAFSTALSAQFDDSYVLDGLAMGNKSSQPDRTVLSPDEPNTTASVSDVEARLQLQEPIPAAADSTSFISPSDTISLRPAPTASKKSARRPATTRASLVRNTSNRAPRSSRNNTKASAGVAKEATSTAAITRKLRASTGKTDILGTAGATGVTTPVELTQQASAKTSPAQRGKIHLRQSQGQPDTNTTFSFFQPPLPSSTPINPRIPDSTPSFTPINSRPVAQVDTDTAGIDPEQAEGDMARWKMVKKRTVHPSDSQQVDPAAFPVKSATANGVPNSPTVATEEPTDTQPGQQTTSPMEKPPKVKRARKSAAAPTAPEATDDAVQPEPEYSGFTETPSIAQLKQVRAAPAEKPMKAKRTPKSIALSSSPVATEADELEQETAAPAEKPPKAKRARKSTAATTAPGPTDDDGQPEPDHFGLTETPTIAQLEQETTAPAEKPLKAKRARKSVAVIISPDATGADVQPEQEPTGVTEAPQKAKRTRKSAGSTVSLAMRDRNAELHVEPEPMDLVEKAPEPDHTVEEAEPTKAKRTRKRVSATIAPLAEDVVPPEPEATKTVEKHGKAKRTRKSTAITNDTINVRNDGAEYDQDVAGPAERLSEHKNKQTRLTMSKWGTIQLSPDSEAGKEEPMKNGRALQNGKSSSKKSASAILAHLDDSLDTTNAAEDQATALPETAESDHTPVKRTRRPRKSVVAAAADADAQVESEAAQVAETIDENVSIARQPPKKKRKSGGRKSDALESPTTGHALMETNDNSNVVSSPPPLPKKPRKKKGDDDPDFTPAVEDSAETKNVPANSSKVVWWSAEEKERLDSLITEYGERNGLSKPDLVNLVQFTIPNAVSDMRTTDPAEIARWKNAVRDFWGEIRQSFPNRTTTSIHRTARRRWHAYEKRGGDWTPEEEERLAELNRIHPTQWKLISQHMGRSAEDCRDRWRNYLQYGTERNKYTWSDEEVSALQEAVAEFIQRLRDERLETHGTLDDYDPFIDLNWHEVSKRAGGTRSRLQCLYKWKSLQGDEDEGSIARRKKKQKRKTSIGAGRMLPGDQAKIILDIVDQEPEDEESINWKKIAYINRHTVWTTKDRKEVWRMLVLEVGRRDDINDTCNAILELLTDRYGTEALGHFYQPEKQGESEEADSEVEAGSDTGGEAVSAAEPVSPEPQPARKRKRQSGGEAAGKQKRRSYTGAQRKRMSAGTQSNRNYKSNELITASDEESDE